MKFDYDVIIIGSGPAGFSCAMQSSKFDKKVLIVEANADHLGGTWINSGTVPSKSLREAAKSIQDFHSQFADEKDRKPYEKFRMEDLLRYKKSILESKNQKVKNDLIKNEIETYRGKGKLVGKNEVEVTNQLNETKTFTAKKILLATGSSPTEPANFDVDHSNILNYESILNVTHIPRRLTIVGAGIISFEYATIFAALGTRVTILTDSNDILPFLDHEIKTELLKLLKKKNIQLYTGVNVEHVTVNKLRTCTEIGFKAQSGDTRLQVIETEHVLYVGGKKPNLDGLGLESVGIELDEEGYLKVDDSFKTNVENIYGAGDVIGFPSLASASFVQGRLAASDMFGGQAENYTHSIPYGIYSIPEISGIGLTEQDAKNQNIDVTVGRAYYENITQADIGHSKDGLLKLVFRTDNLKLLGVHIIGDHAPDLIHLGQSVMAFNGDVRYFFQHVLNYPSFSEAYRIAAFNGVNRVHKAGVKYKKILKQ
ncbi:MAG: Si-specific NAD(P)(+) transhydrogenase [Balneolaceae bacterium]